MIEELTRRNAAPSARLLKDSSKTLVSELLRRVYATPAHTPAATSKLTKSDMRNIALLSQPLSGVGVLLHMVYYGPIRIITARTSRRGEEIQNGGSFDRWQP